ncbi:hypothetical protein APHAL10511_004696 [Amanita phalloides]|nr:hypothetical protein APHAL10511_004696 [Amanita phalloides]
MSLSFATNTNSSSRHSKRIQIHVVEADGFATKSPPAYVTIESPGLGSLHQTETASKGKKLVWHENTRIIELKPNAGIKFTVRRQTVWPVAHSTLGYTNTYDLCKLIEMQGKNDRETCVTLPLNPPKAEKTPSKRSLVINIRDLDTTEKMRQIRQYAATASQRRKGKPRELDLSDSSSTSASSLDLPRTPTTSSSFSSSFSIASAPLPPSSFTPPPAMSASVPHLAPLSPTITAEAFATSAMSAAVSSPCSPSTASSWSSPSSTAITSQRFSTSDIGKQPSPIGTPQNYSQ